MRFTDKVIIITGAAQGLGAHYAQRFAAEGARVVASDLGDCADTVAAVTADGGEAISLTADVTDAAACASLVTGAVDRFGRVDAVVNNAALYGQLNFGPFDGIDSGEWDACMAVNVKGLWHMAKAAVPAMSASGGGAIINIASMAATYGMPFGLHYTASKGAVIGLTRGLAREVARHDIRVNAVAPSLVLTEGTERFFGDKADRAKQAVAGDQAIRRNLTVDDVAGTVLFLASDDAQFITGQTVAVDGGTVFL